MYSNSTCAFDKNYAYLTIVCVIFFEYPNGAPIGIVLLNYLNSSCDIHSQEICLVLSTQNGCWQIGSCHFCRICFGTFENNDTHMTLC